MVALEMELPTTQDNEMSIEHRGATTTQRPTRVRKRRRPFKSIKRASKDLATPLNRRAWSLSSLSSPSSAISRPISAAGPVLTHLHTTVTRALTRTRSRPQFERFTELPIEIRLLIWEYTFVPRVHELHPCAKLYNDRMTFRSNSGSTPAVFHVCRESRELALKKYNLMAYEPRNSGMTGKGILRFYYSPELDTLFLNSLMGLFIMFMLLEDEDEYIGIEVMKGWQNVAFDAGRVHLISLFAGIAGKPPRPRLKAVFPSLKDFIIAFDYTAKGKIRFRTSVWPGENGTSLEELKLPPYLDPYGNEEYADADEYDWAGKLNRVLLPMRRYLDQDFKNEDQKHVPTVKLANVKRKTFIRGDIRYAFRKTCSFFGMKPRGPFRRL